MHCEAFPENVDPEPCGCIAHRSADPVHPSLTPVIQILKLAGCLVNPSHFSDKPVGDTKLLGYDCDMIMVFAVFTVNVTFIEGVCGMFHKLLLIRPLGNTTAFLFFLQLLYQ